MRKVSRKRPKLSLSENQSCSKFPKTIDSSRNIPPLGLGTNEGELSYQFLVQSLWAMGITLKDTPESMNQAFVRAHAAVAGIKPKDELEGMLAVQMVASHNAVMEFFMRAMHPDQCSQGVDANINRATKLMRLFLNQIETLEKYRGRSIQQTVEVRHVNVHSGGQAIVGAVTSGGEGGKGEN